MLCCSQADCWNEAKWVVRWGDHDDNFYWSCPSCVGGLLSVDEENVVYPLDWDIEETGDATVIEPGEFVSTITRDVLAHSGTR